MDSVSRGEQVESELDMFIARRDEKRRRDEGDRSVEEMWAESCRHHDETRRQQNRAAWHRYLMDSADQTERVAAEIAVRKRARAQALMEAAEPRKESAA